MANAVPAWIRPTRKMCFDGGFDGPVGRFTCNGVLIKGKAQPEVSTPGAGAASSGLVDERLQPAFWTDIDYFPTKRLTSRVLVSSSKNMSCDSVSSECRNSGTRVLVNCMLRTYHTFSLKFDSAPHKLRKAVVMEHC